MSRRALLVATPLLAASSAALQAFQSPQSPPIPTSVHSQFPSHEPALAREMVAVSHSRLERVQELLDRSPALANATWDWGFGDWETALGAASHTGRREIAMLLMAHGAPPEHLHVRHAWPAGCRPGLCRGESRYPGNEGATRLDADASRSAGEGSRRVRRGLSRGGRRGRRGLRDVTLADEAKAQYLGTYGHGGGTPADAAFEITETRSGRLGIRRLPDGDVRQLYHLGDHEFHPAGASAVRVRFDVEDGAAGRLTIVDGVPVLTADRAV